MKDIIMCGHSRCGAVNGLLHPEQVAGSPAVASGPSRAEATRRIARGDHGPLDEYRSLTTAVAENVLVQRENLRKLPSVAAGLAKGD